MAAVNWIFGRYDQIIQRNRIEASYYVALPLVRLDGSLCTSNATQQLGILVNCVRRIRRRAVSSWGCCDLAIINKARIAAEIVSEFE